MVCARLMHKKNTSKDCDNRDNNNNNNKLKRVVTVAKNGMESIGLKGNEKKCAVIHVKRGQVEQGSEDMKIAALKPIKCLDQHNTYKFLGVFENTK